MCRVPQAPTASIEAGPRRRSAGPAALLVAGACGGPLLIVSSLAQAMVREGFDVRQQPPSALELGSSGVLQQATFVVSGLLILVGAVGVHRAEAGRWAARMLGGLGLSLAAAGVFTMDPAFGFPPGTPPGAGESVSWHAAVHGVLFPLGFAALVATAVLTAQRFRRDGRPGMQVTALAASGTSLVLSIWPNLAAEPDGRFLPMWAGVVIAYAWVTLMLFDLARRDVALDRLIRVSTSTTPERRRRGRALPG